jgi:uncharacterized protein (UPF0264 family)
MTGMLASVNSLEEALLALSGGADIIDLKQPLHGALGALPPETICLAVQAINGRKPVSATIGDLPMHPATVSAAVSAAAENGVDFIKIGFFPGGNWVGVIAALSPLAQQGLRLIAVLFADAPYDAAFVETVANAGFSGVMLDTMNKNNGSLVALMPAERIAAFVAAAKHHGLLCGLAGSLRKENISVLLPLEPDYLGFRGALCRGTQRTALLDKEAMAEIRWAISGIVRQERRQ